MSGNDEALLDLLGWQIRRYTSGESTSLRAETARELLLGLRYTLSMAQTPALTDGGPESAYRAGLRTIETELSRFEKLYAMACLDAVDMGNLSYRDTLRSIGGFRKKYDRLYFPHIVPCDIDYQLCRPVSEELLGVSYVNEYLRRLITENRFLARFDFAALEALLSRSSPSHRQLLINLYSPVAEAALGLTLCGEDIWTLKISDAGRTRLADLFHPLTDTAALAALDRAAERLARALELKESERAYLRETAMELWPRLASALPTGDLTGVLP